jgi:hypothetical protein
MQSALSQRGLYWVHRRLQHALESSLRSAAAKTRRITSSEATTNELSGSSTACRCYWAQAAALCPPAALPRRRSCGLLHSNHICCSAAASTLRCCAAVREALLRCTGGHRMRRQARWDMRGSDGAHRAAPCILRSTSGQHRLLGHTFSARRTCTGLHGCDDERHTERMPGATGLRTPHACRAADLLAPEPSSASSLAEPARIAWCTTSHSHTGTVTHRHCAHYRQCAHLLSVMMLTLASRTQTGTWLRRQHRSALRVCSPPPVSWPRSRWYSATASLRLCSGVQHRLRHRMHARTFQMVMQRGAHRSSHARPAESALCAENTCVAMRAIQAAPTMLTDTSVAAAR